MSYSTPPSQVSPTPKMFIAIGLVQGFFHTSSLDIIKIPLGYPAVSLSHGDPVLIISQDQSLQELQHLTDAGRRNGGRDRVSQPRASEDWACSAWLSDFNMSGSYDPYGNTGHEYHHRTQLQQENRSRTHHGPSGSTSHPDQYDPSKSKALACVSISKKYALGSSSRNLKIILDKIIFLAWNEFSSK